MAKKKKAKPEIIPEPAQSRPANDFDPEATVDLRGSSPALPTLLRNDDSSKDVAAPSDAAPEAAAEASPEATAEASPEEPTADAAEEPSAPATEDAPADAEPESLVIETSPETEPLSESRETAPEASPEDVSRTHLRGLVEALVFASDKPLKTGEIAKLASAPSRQIKEVLDELKGDYTKRGVQLDEIAGGWAFRTNVQYAPFIRDLTGQKPVKLSRAQLETLAIVAYRQPVTRPEVDDIRGVDCGPVLKTLLERDLVRILGKKDEPGRPILYGTSHGFLELFNLKSLKDLPTLREFTELNEDSRRVVEQELGEVLDAHQSVLAGDDPTTGESLDESDRPTLESIDPNVPADAIPEDGRITPVATSRVEDDELADDEAEKPLARESAGDEDEDEPKGDDEPADDEPADDEPAKKSSYDPADELEFPDDDDSDDDDDESDDEDDEDEDDEDDE